MAALSYVELLDGHARALRRYPLPLDPGETASVGRDFACDVVVDDPHVAAVHLRLRREPDGGLSVEDAGSLNGIQLPGRRERSANFQLGADAGPQDLQIGRTRLRLHVSAPTVEPELPLRASPRLWPLAALALLSGFGLLLGSQWLEETREFRWMARVGDLLPLLMLLGIWSAGWALVNRVVAGRAMYFGHVAVAGLGLAGFVLLSGLLEVMAYAGSLSWLPAYSFAPGWLALGLAGAVHLRLLGAGHMGIKLGAVLLVMLLGMTPRMIQLAYPEPGSEPTHVVRTLQPPSFRLVQPQSLEVFMQDADQLRARLDAARETPAEASDFDEFDEGIAWP